MARGDGLARYRKRRNFRATGEPRGGRRRGSGSRPRFVVQAHDASRLHYDLRLEADGVMKSWAVPKGPSPDPRQRRLAMPTEDHPLEYQEFEGVIPEGEYGAGTVLVWDAGTYRNLTERDGHPVSVSEGIERGHLVVSLEGDKLRGGYALTRMRRDSRKGRDDDWLFVKTDDAEADARRNPVRSRPASVRSGRTLEEVARESHG